jgi:AcrR family transcriptional regulator
MRSVTKRDDQREATRKKILDAAFEVLAARGYAALSTLAVQQAAGVSRGALLHHFSTRFELCQALIAELVGRNELAVQRSLRRLPADLDPVSRAIRALYDALSRPAFQTELGLWAAARTDRELRSALRVAERTAGRDLRRVMDEAFGLDCTQHPSYPMVSELTIALIQGLTVSGVLRRSDRAARRMIENWAALARQILAGELAHPAASNSFEIQPSRSESL